MEPSPESTNSQQACDWLRVNDVVRNRNTVIRVQSEYVFDDLKTEGPVTASWQAQAETAGLSIQGTVQGVLALECVRCLEPFSVPVDLKIQERYVFDSYVEAQEREKELQSEDFFEVVKEDGELDLKDLAYQFLIMESENHSLCGRSECQFNG